MFTPLQPYFARYTPQSTSTVACQQPQVTLGSYSNVQAHGFSGSIVLRLSMRPIEDAERRVTAAPRFGTLRFEAAILRPTFSESLG